MADIFEKCRNYKDAKIAMRMGIYGYVQPIASAQGPEVILDGKTYIMAGSNNYLGLANDPEMKKAAVEAVQKYGTGVAGSRLLNGNTQLADNLEKKLSKKGWCKKKVEKPHTLFNFLNFGLLKT